MTQRAVLGWVGMVVLVLAGTAGCSCDGPGPSRRCTMDEECNPGQRCDVDRCVAIVDMGVDAATNPDVGVCAEEQRCRSGSLCCAGNEECVDGVYCYPVCANTRCGDNQSECCGAGEVCLDGVTCAADCAPGTTLCGADNDVCCDAGDVCLNDTCVTPGVACNNDFDCQDAALYCEATIGLCLTTPVLDPVCEVRPVFDDVELLLEWQFTGVMVGGVNYNQVITYPTVGDISGDGVPDVVFMAYTGTAWHDPVVVALHGDTGGLLWVIDRLDGKGAEADGIVLANFDPSDDALEVAYLLDAGGVRIVQGDGVTEIARRAFQNDEGTLEVADMNMDGIPDLISGCIALNGVDIEDPTLDFLNVTTCTNPGSGYRNSAVANLDADPFPELTTGGVTYSRTGGTTWNVLWNALDGQHGLVAVADVDLNGTPEVVRVEGGQVTVLAGATGTVLMGPWAIPGGGEGGAPTVADFDGDGLPEISAAGRGAYAVYDPDCLLPAVRVGGDCGGTMGNVILWQRATQDLSSSITGSSVFDFQGDGVAEVIYNDECFLHIYDGATGRELLAEPLPNSSRTSIEYPIVVDIDGDGNSEIVVPANNDQAVTRDNCPAAYAAAFGVDVSELPEHFAAGTHGLFVYGDANDRWVPTRTIWNQFNYRVTNISDSGEVPAAEPNNWSTEGLNNYRQNVQGAGIFNAPNLVVELDSVANCLLEETRLSAVITNVGSRGAVMGAVVNFYRIDVLPETLVGTVTLTDPLLPGESRRVSVTADIVEGVQMTFEVRVDEGPSPVVNECREDDNSDTVSEVCPGFG